MIGCIPFFNDDISWFEIIYTAVIPVALFFVGLWFGKLLEKQKEKMRYARLEKYFFGLLNQLTRKNTSQIVLLKEASVIQDNFVSGNIMTELASGESHLLLKEIDRSELFSGFILSKKTKTDERTAIFEKLISSIDFVYKQYIALEANNLNLPHIADTYTTLWNNSQLELNKTINILKPPATQHQKMDVLLLEIEKLEDKVKTEKGDKPYLEDLKKGYEIFLEPFIKLLISHSHDPRVPLLMDLANRAKFAFQMLKKEKEKNKQYFLEIANTLEKENNDINSSILDYNKL